MNATLVYNDDERGGEEGYQSVSTQGKRGMGDYYVIDIVQSSIGVTTGSAIVMETESTLYWHER